MSDLDQQLTDALVDGRITEHDADEVRNFAAFLSKIDARPDTPEARKRFGDAYREHYPEEYARAVGGATDAGQGGGS